MRYAPFILFFAVSTTAASTDFPSFFQFHADMFNEVSRRYNDREDYKIKPLPGQSIARRASNRQKGVGKTGSDASSVPPPVTQVFKSKSAWSEMTATMTNYHTHFILKVVSTAAAEKWILEKDDADKTVIAQGGLNDQNSFVVDQPSEFTPGMNLRIMVIVDGEQYPSILPLK